MDDVVPVNRALSACFPASSRCYYPCGEIGLAQQISYDVVEKQRRIIAVRVPRTTAI